MEIFLTLLYALVVQLAKLWICNPLLSVRVWSSASDHITYSYNVVDLYESLGRKTTLIRFQVLK